MLSLSLPRLLVLSLSLSQSPVLSLSLPRLLVLSLSLVLVLVLVLVLSLSPSLSLSPVQSLSLSLSPVQSLSLSPVQSLSPVLPLSPVQSLSPVLPLSLSLLLSLTTPKVSPAFASARGKRQCSRRPDNLNRGGIGGGRTPRKRSLVAHRINGTDTVLDRDIPLRPIELGSKVGGLKIASGGSRARQKIDPRDKGNVVAVCQG